MIPAFFSSIVHFMGDLKGAPALDFNFPLLYKTFKSGIAASGEPIPLEWGRFGEGTLAQS